MVAELSVCHNLILAFILNDFLPRSFERGQGTSVRFRPQPQGRGQGTAELIQIVQYCIQCRKPEFIERIDTIICTA